MEGAVAREFDALEVRLSKQIEAAAEQLVNQLSVQALRVRQLEK